MYLTHMYDRCTQSSLRTLLLRGLARGLARVEANILIADLANKRHPSPPARTGAPPFNQGRQRVPQMVPTFALQSLIPNDSTSAFPHAQSARARVQLLYWVRLV